MKEFPKEIFVSIEEDGEDNWLNAFEDPSSHADLGKDKIAGRYEFRESVRITGQVSVDAI